MTGEYAVDLEKVRDFLNQKRDNRSSRLKARWEEAQRDFERTVEHFRLRYNPQRSYQWGSLLDFSRFSEISDIDIALEGIAGPQKYFAILGDAMNLTDFPLDIVEMKNLDPETAAGIREKRIVVYEKGK